MYIDLHMHCMEGSDDSHISIPQIVEKAKRLGLDGVCITDHDTMRAKKIAEKYSKDLNFNIFIGAEILTHEGDIVVFGVDSIPEGMVHAQELIDYVNERNGATISAHPYRENNRGLGDNLFKVKGLTAVEGYNGSTKDYNNIKAQNTAFDISLPIVGSSDCHVEEKIGVFATYFENKINSVNDLVKALKIGALSPVKHNGEKYEFMSVESDINRSSKIV